MSRALCIGWWAALAACVGLAGVGATAEVSLASYRSGTWDTTPPSDAGRTGDGRFTVVAYGDPEDQLLGFEDVIAAVGARVEPRFGVVMGDLTVRGARIPESYVALRHEVADEDLAYPVLAIPGNHDGEPSDARTEAGDAYAQHFGPRNWWFRHDGRVFVGLDDSTRMLSHHARAVLAEAAAADGGTPRVIVFLHLPPWRPEGEVPAPGVLPHLREALGTRLEAIVSAHEDAWSVARDDDGTLHVCVGAEPGLGWPKRSTPQLAALLHFDDAGLRVEPVRVPYRVELGESIRRGAAVKIHPVLRHAFAPVPVWGAALLAAVGALVLLRFRPARSARGEHAQDGGKVRDVPGVGVVVRPQHGRRVDQEHPGHHPRIADG